MSAHQTNPPPIPAIDWACWKPKEVGVLCFIIQEGQILLIHKKRGLGAGKINGPGGRLEPGEAPEQGAIRETQEEVGLTPTGLKKAGELAFQFADGYSLRCHVFTASGYEGILVETAEATPFWNPVDAIPYDKMWEDDQHWLPLMLQGRGFMGRFLFEGERMAQCVVEEVEVSP